MSYEQGRRDADMAFIFIMGIIILALLLFAAIKGGGNIAQARDQCAAKGGVLVKAQYSKDVCISRKVLIIE